MTRYIKVKFLRNSETVGQPYIYKTDLDVQIGETVMLTEKAKGIIFGFVPPELVEGPEKIKEIFGQIKGEEEKE